MSAIAGSVRALCALSVLFSAALSIAPQGGARRVTEILCAAALLLAAVSPLRGLDGAAYALELAKSAERAGQIEDKTDNINRLVIQERYGAYIMDKATENGVALKSVTVEVRWDTDGVWVPCSARLVGECTPRERELIGSILFSQLGIALSAQEWSGHD